MELVDTHCHIQEVGTPVGQDYVREKWAKGGFASAQEVIANAVETGVTRLVCVGCTFTDSEQAVALASADEHCWASIGIHPHEAKDHLAQDLQARFAALATQPRVVAVGECGLDYYYNHSPKEAQIELLRFQLELAAEHNLPLIFHVRDAFEDFWPIFDDFEGLRGVIHSFTASQKDLQEILKRDLYVGLNGIMTFTKDQAQLEAAKAIPLDRLVLETDAPFLTPTPYRGKICEPKHVLATAEFLAKLRGEALADLTRVTTQNARHLFSI